MIGGSNDLGMGIVIQLKDEFSNTAQTIKNSLGGLQSGLGKLGTQAFFINEIHRGLENLSSTLTNVIAPGEAFDLKMHELEAITGATGKTLDDISKSARQMALDFGVTASDAVESYKIILSRLSPELAKVPSALDAMGKDVVILSKTMGGDTLGAVEALTTAMNQYGVDLSDPTQASLEMTRMMDIMSTAAQVGAAEVPQIAGALKTAGLSAKTAGISFEELNASIQIMGRGSLFGAEAGTQLRNILARMGEGRFMPKKTLEALKQAGVDVDILANKTIPLSERLTELAKIQNDNALVSQFFGVESQNAGKLLLSNIDGLKDWTGQMYKEGNAMSQATTVMGSFSEKMKRTKAWLDNIAIGFFEGTKEALPFIQTFLMLATAASSIAPLIVAFETMQVALTGVAASAWAAITPLLPFIALVVAIAAAGYFFSEALEGNNKWLIALTGTLIFALGPIAWVVGAFIALYKGVSEFKKVMAGEAEPQGGVMGFLTRIGGIIMGLTQIFSSWNGEFFTMSDEMEASLKKMGILQFVLNLGTWVVRIKEFMKGFIKPFTNAYDRVSEVFTKIAVAFGPVTSKLEDWGFFVDKATSSTSTWNTVGEVMGYIFTAMFFPIVAVIDAIGFLIDTFDEVVAAGSAFVSFGAGIVDGIMTGIANSWDSLVKWLLGLITELPGGSFILDKLGLSSGTGHGDVTVKPNNALSEGILDVGNKVNETQVEQNKANQPLIFDKSTTTHEAVSVNLLMDGDAIAEKMNVKLAKQDSRR